MKQKSHKRHYKRCKRIKKFVVSIYLFAQTEIFKLRNIKCIIQEKNIQKSPKWHFKRCKRIEKYVVLAFIKLSNTKCIYYTGVNCVVDLLLKFRQESGEKNKMYASITVFFWIYPLFIGTKDGCGVSVLATQA